MSAKARPDLPRLQLGDLASADPASLLAGARHELIRIGPVELGGADLRGATFLETWWDQVGTDEANLGRARLLESRFTGMGVRRLRLAGGTLREVEIRECRIGVLDLSGAQVRTVLVQGCKVDYLNLRGASARDVTLVDCLIGELDLGEATASDWLVTGGQLPALTLADARLTRVDLRDTNLGVIAGIRGLAGAVISEGQLLYLAPQLAAHVGVRVE